MIGINTDWDESGLFAGKTNIDFFNARALIQNYPIWQQVPNL